MSVWNRATFEEKYAAVCVLFAVLYLAVRQESHQTNDWRRRRQRDSLTLEEEALARLERGETLELPRWHGDDLELRGAPSTSEDTSGQDGTGDDQDDETDADDEEE